MQGILVVVIRAIMQAVAGWASKSPAGDGQRTAYYSPVIIGIVSLPVLIVGGLGVLIAAQSFNGYGNPLFPLAMIALAALMAFLLSREFIGRRAEWNEHGVKLRWLGGKADLGWNDVVSVEVRREKNYARLRFRDGRTFGVSVYLTGQKELLNAITARGVPIYPWGKAATAKAAG